MNIIAHIYRKGNHYANKMTNIGLSLNSYIVWGVHTHIKELIAQKVELTKLKPC